MGQRANEIEDELNDELEDTMDSSRGTVVIESVDYTVVEADDVETARAQIEETRAEMTTTVDALKEKLSPANLMQEAKDSVREATIGKAEEAVSNAVDSAKDMASEAGHKARGIGSMLVETIKENPMAAAVTGAGLAWLYMGAQKHADRPRYGIYDEDLRMGVRHMDREESRTGRVTSALSEAKDTVKETASDVTHRVGETASDVAQTVQQKASDLSSAAQDKAYRAKDSLSEFMGDNPLMMGAVALMVGAAVGLMLPETQPERRLMGETRDRLVDQVSDKAQDVAHKAQAVGQEALHTVKQELQGAVDATKQTVRDEASKQGMTTS